ncbi:cell adhesion molecule-related/down-regulated by oncogenes-like isoform X1 [Lethenteron reissneri]|uniref:cell adhesion molecule-related/down-regulated by oncogenes-like isoform X1 n=2 Tax=Lethenteron reissneri TaxID=7753 RepID=UPI002AB68721|nr:cell adhesion molecule-related/down-regulated by oncogenes-like isoform X1 [Lethenteron reissneri]
MHVEPAPRKDLCPRSPEWPRAAREPRVPMACRVIVPCLLAAATLCIARATEPSLRLTSEPESVTQRPGGEVRLGCTTDPQGAALDWQYRGGGGDGAWENAARQAGVLLAGSELLIAALRPEHEGAYRCVATTGNGSVTSAPANVTLARLGEFRWYARRVLEVALGESAEVHCSLPESRPPAQARYKFKQKWLGTTAGRVELLPSGTLRISNVSREDVGVYRCAAYNPVTQEQRVQRGGTRLRLVERGGGAEHAQPKEEEEEEAAEETATERLSLPELPLQDEPAEAEEEPPSGTPGSSGVPTTVPAAAAAAAVATNSALLPPEAPIMLSAPRSSSPDSYELRWRPGRDGGAPIMAYLVKYRKVTVEDPVVWQSMRVPADQRSLSLTELEADSLYELEMVARSRAGNGQPAMLTFRTAKEKNNSSRKPGSGLRPVNPWRRPSNDDSGVNSYSLNYSPAEPDAHTVPEAPWAVSVRSGASGAVFVSWMPRGTGGSPVSAFRVECRRVGRGAGEWKEAASGIPPAKLAVQIDGLAAGWAYRFRVAALNAHGESPWSVPSTPFYLSGSPGGASASQRLLAAPHISATEAVSDTAIRITWTFASAAAPAQPVQKVTVYYRPTDSDNDEDYHKEILHGSRDWHVLSGLQPETSYDIKIQWFSTAGESEFSNVMICETRAAGSLLDFTDPTGRDGADRPAPPPAVDSESMSPHAAPSRDLLYLLLGMGLGLLLLVLVLFVGLWVWRARQHCRGYGSPGPVLPNCKAEYLYPSLDYTSVSLPGTGLINGGIVGPAMMNGGSPSPPSVGPLDERSDASGQRGASGPGPGAAAAAAAVSSSCCCGNGAVAGLWEGAGGGGDGAVGPPSTGHHIGCVGCLGLEYQQRGHHVLNGRGLYHAVPQAESAECNDCRNCSNNNRCSPKPGRSSPTPHEPHVSDSSPRGGSGDFDDERDRGGGDADGSGSGCGNAAGSGGDPSPPPPELPPAAGEPGSADRSEVDTTSESDGEQPAVAAQRRCPGALLANGAALVPGARCKRGAENAAEQGGIRHVRVRPVSDYIRPSAMDYQMDRTKMQNGSCKHTPPAAGSNGLYLEMQLLKVS